MLYFEERAIMKIPKFSEWMRFSEYKNFSKRNLPGVYLLAHFKRKPSGKANPKSEEIIYVGETTKQTLAKRLNQFCRSALKRTREHSGGSTYSKEFLNSRSRDRHWAKLHIALLAVDKEGMEGSALFIKVVERIIIWEYYKKYKQSPKCNLT